MKYKLIIFDDRFADKEIETDSLDDIEKVEAGLKILEVPFRRLTEIEVEQGEEND